MKKIFLVSTIITTLLLSSCGLLTANESAELRGTSWNLVSYAGNFPIEGKDMTANFDGSEISGSASCNHYFGGYETKGNQINIVGLGWTEMACMDPEGIMEQEQVIMSMLSNAESFSIMDNKLDIKTTSGESLIFEMADVMD